MYGTLLNNSQIIDLVASRKIEVWPHFDEAALQLADYPLTIGAVIGIGEATPRAVASPYTPERIGGGGAAAILAPNDYRIVVVKERIVLCEGLVGQFLPASSAIEAGLLLTMGKLESPFGRGGEYIRFGVFNASGGEVELRSGSRVAYLRIHDLRGLKNATVRFTERDSAIYESRRLFPPHSDGDLDFEKDTR